MARANEACVALPGTVGDETEVQERRLMLDNDVPAFAQTGANSRLP
jgi:hypothetical protein